MAIPSRGLSLAGNGAAALLILNNLRTNGKLQNTEDAPAGLGVLTLQVGEPAQIDQLMRERAIWLYGSDLRRDA